MKRAGAWIDVGYKKKLLGAGLLALSLAGGAVFALEHSLFSRSWFSLRQWYHADEWRDRSLWLPDYRVTIEGRPIEGIDGEVSALTWNGDTKTLFTVIRDPEQIIELSTEGKVVRRIDLKGVGDPEAIEYIGDDRFIVADERSQQLFKLRVDAQTAVLDAAEAPRLIIGMDRNGNKGFEGLAWDGRNKRLFVANERDPVTILEIRGFPLEQYQPLNVTVESSKRRDRRLFVRDISGLNYEPHYGHLLALSDESKLLLELDAKGRPISTLSLLPGMHGLSSMVGHPEGIAVGDNDVLYIVGEPNLFYVFEKQPANK